MEPKFEKCPFCGFGKVASILYGMPVFSEDLEKDIEEGRIVLGGCCIIGNSPDFECKGCGRRWKIVLEHPEEEEETDEEESDEWENEE